MKKSALSVFLAAVMTATSLCSCSAQAGQVSADQSAKAEETADAEKSANEAEASAEQQAEAPAEAEASAEAETAAEAEVSAEADAAVKAGDQKEETGAMPLFTLDEHYFYSSEETDDGFLTLASGTYENIALTEEVKAIYPALETALESFSAENAAQAKEGFNEIVDAAKATLENYEDDLSDFPSGEQSVKIEPVRCDSDVLSFYCVNSCSYPGAAHGLLGYEGYNYDTATGEKIALTDVVTDPSALVPAVLENLVSPSAGTPVEDADDAVKEYFDQSLESLVWVLDRDALVVRFAPYEVAPYAMGTLEARISFAAYPDLFTGKYGAVKGAFARKLEPFAWNTVDIDDDGQTESIMISGEYDYEVDLFDYTGIELIVGLCGCMEEASFYSMKAALLHTEDGRNYVYAETKTDNDYTSLYVFVCGEEYPELVDKIDGMGFAALYREGPEAADGDDMERAGYSEQYPILDPSHFALVKRTDLMSTYSAMRFYEVGEDGMPSPLTDYYEISAAQTLTSLQSLEVELVDPQTGELTGEKMELPEGSACTLWHTNGEDTVDLLTGDGQAFRLNVEGTWPQTVNGIDLQKAFDGTMFAG